MLRLIFIAILVYICYRLFKGLFGPSREIHRGPSNNSGVMINEMVQDPFCETYIPRREALKRIIGGQEYYFCSSECADRFESGEKK